MGSYGISLIIFSTICCAVIVSISHGADVEERKVYVVYMGGRGRLGGDVPAAMVHLSMLNQVLGRSAKESLLHSYGRSFNGFAAKLNKEEARKIAGVDGVVSVFPSEKKQLQTTRSWDFMGFSDHVSRSVFESDVIVGMLDSGIWLESESFSDKGFGPPPSKWRGSCEESSTFKCNNKIIGAKHYRTDGHVPPGAFPSPRDRGGHGTHTSSTAAGGVVADATLFGLGSGTARGGVPAARIAVYKICWSDGCSDADILAAFDDAIADGVDIISLSVGGISALDYFLDSIAIGAFHSMKYGILTSNAAGNSGPSPSTILNFSPWSLSVGASTIDRKFVTGVKLGDGQTFQGISINTFDLNNTLFPAIYAGDAPNTTAGFSKNESRFCSENSLDKNLVRGKIVFCDRLTFGDSVLLTGALGTVMQGVSFNDTAFSFLLPGSYIGVDDGACAVKYLNSTKQPTANIMKSDEIKDELAPFVASFSSRGPNPITADILKPDLAAPGVDILAAWSEGSTMTGYKDDSRVVPFNIISGTSMACPHATAAAAYVKSFNPTWSPSAVKSSLMTTTFPMTAGLNSDAEFAYGAGHLNPSKAINPGLVYDACEIDYVKLLCGQGYDSKKLRIITGDESACSASTNGTVWDMNYPSFALSSTTQEPITRVFHRTLTNVGSPSGTYQSTVTAPPGLQAVVEPKFLSFSSVGEKQSFTMTVTAQMADSMVSGSLVWDDGIHRVRSPIVAYLVSI